MKLQTIHDPSLNRVPSLPSELLLLILSPHLLSPSESRGVPGTCRRFKELGQALIWNSIEVELGGCLVQPAFEQALEQPRHRIYIKNLVLSWRNTAQGSANKEERKFQALHDFALLLARLPALERLTLRVFDEEIILVQLLQSLVQSTGAWCRGPGGGGDEVRLMELSLETRGKRSSNTAWIPLDLIFESLRHFRHLHRLCIDFPSGPYIGQEIDYLGTSPPLTSLTIARGHELTSEAAISLTRWSKESLRSLSITGDDEFLQIYLDELEQSGYQLSSLEVGAAYPSVLFNHGAQRPTNPNNPYSPTDEDEAPILERLSKILPHHPTLLSLTLGSIGTRPLSPPPSLSPSPPNLIRVRQGTLLSCSAFWKSLPKGLKYLSILCRLSRGAEEVAGFLREKRCEGLKKISFAASEGKLIAHLCQELGIVFEVDA